MLAAGYDPSAGITLQDDWSEYVTAHKTIADADDTVVFVDHSARIPATTATDTYGLYSTVDDLHPSPGGAVNLWMAETYAALLTSK